MAENNLLMSLAEIIGKECQRQVETGKYLGSQKYHIESLKRIKNPDGTDSPFLFEVVTWTEESEDPRRTVHVDYPHMVQIVSEAILWAILYDAAAEIIKVKAE